MDPARPREDPLPGNGLGGVRELTSGPAASPREKNESVLELELLLVDETELDRVGSPPTAVHEPLEVGESTAESSPPGGKSDVEADTGDGSVTNVRSEAREESDPVEADDE